MCVCVCVERMGKFTGSIKDDECVLVSLEVEFFFVVFLLFIPDTEKGC